MSNAAVAPILWLITILYVMAIFWFVNFGRINLKLGGSLHVLIEDPWQPLLQLAVVYAALLFAIRAKHPGKAVKTLAFSLFSVFILALLNAAAVDHHEYNPAVFICLGIAYIPVLALLWRAEPSLLSPSRRPVVFSALAVFIPAFIVYFFNGHSEIGGDTAWNSLLPFYVLQGGAFPIAKAYITKYELCCWMEMGEGYLPIHPIGASLFVFPIAAFHALCGIDFSLAATGWVQRVSAVWVAALSAAILFQWVFILTRNLWITGLMTAAFALGSPQASVSSITIWQHGPASLLINIGLLLMIRGERENNPRLLGLAALPLAFLPLMRPHTVLFYFGGLAAVALLNKKAVIRYFAWSVFGVAAVLGVHLGLYHNILGGYSHFAEADKFMISPIEGLAGLLFSPNRGLFIFSPFFLLSIPGFYIAVTRRSVIGVCMALASAVYLLIHAIWGVWYAGWSIGPRFATETAPILILLCVLFMERYRALKADILMAGLVALSILITASGMLFPREQDQWNVFPNIDLDENHGRLWNFKEWLPLNFIHSLRFKQFRETPVQYFVFRGDLDPAPSKNGAYYRVIAPLAEKPVSILHFPKMSLDAGEFMFRLKGETKSDTAVIKIVINVKGGEERIFLHEIKEKGVFEITQKFRIDAPRYVHIVIFTQGRNGEAALDTAQLNPL